jgi:serpin B
MPTTPVSSSPSSDAALRAVAQGDRDFAARLYTHVRPAPDANVFFSPTSIRLALAMAYAGARGDTQAQMARVLALDDRASAGFAALLAQWSARAALPPGSDAANPWAREQAERSRLVLRIANRLWAQRGKTFRKDFLARLAGDYGAPLEQLDFQHAPDPSRAAINAWVADRTEHKIMDLLAPGSVAPDTRLVLANAVYFKARWAIEFELPTKDEDFTITPGKVVKAPTMHNVDSFRHAVLPGDVPGAALELPYGAPGVAMIVLLPNAKDGLAKLEAKLDGTLLDAVMARLARKRVDVAFPRFRTTSTLMLADVLSAMGMPAAFASGQADFSGMDDTRELFLGTVAHKAFVAVDEHGTEAAAATAMAVYGSAPMQVEPPVPFRADHPFLFFIADTTNQTVLFMGRVIDPTK